MVLREIHERTSVVHMQMLEVSSYPPQPCEMDGITHIRKKRNNPFELVHPLLIIIGIDKNYIYEQDNQNSG